MRHRPNHRKSFVTPKALHTLACPIMPWVDMSMDFVLGYLRLNVTKTRFSKIAHFIACSKTNDVTYITELYFKEVMRLHGIPHSIVSD